MCIEKREIAVKKRFLNWSKENTPPQEFLKKVKETQGEGLKEFLESILDQAPTSDNRQTTNEKIPSMVRKCNHKLKNGPGHNRHIEK